MINIEIIGIIKITILIILYYIKKLKKSCYESNV